MHQSGLSAEPEPSPGGVEIVSIRSAVGQPAQSSQSATRGALPVVCLARHGETAWTVSHRHTGFGSVTVVEPDLAEWNYGAYEGRTSAEIHAERPGWQLFRDGCPGGESPDQVAVRADRLIQRVRAIGGVIRLWDEMQYQRRAVHALERETA